jgi:hypothetical protein
MRNGLAFTAEYDIHSGGGRASTKPAAMQECNSHAFAGPAMSFSQTTHLLSEDDYAPTTACFFTPRSAGDGARTIYRARVG